MQQQQQYNGPPTGQLNNLQYFGPPGPPPGPIGYFGPQHNQRQPLNPRQNLRVQDTHAPTSVPLTASSWNVNGWTDLNQCIRHRVIEYKNSDFYLLSETHLPKDGSITCPGYTSFVNNRQEQHVDAPSPSGGVAILIKNSVLDSYEITVIDKSYDGILGIKA